MDYQTVSDRLTCPHTNSCDVRIEEWGVSAATEEGKATLEVSCQDCQGQDHLMFEVGDLDRSDRSDVDVGDRFTVTEDIQSWMRASVGDECVVTAIINNPVRSDEDLIVGVIGGIDSSAPYYGKIFQLDTFEDTILEHLE